VNDDEIAKGRKVDTCFWKVEERWKIVEFMKFSHCNSRSAYGENRNEVS